MESVNKKEEFANCIEEYVKGNLQKENLLSKIEEFERVDEFKGIDLFENILKELKNSIDELSRKELKQRILLIRSYLE